MKIFFLLPLFVCMIVSLNGQTIEEATKLINEVSNQGELQQFKEKYPNYRAYLSKTPEYKVRDMLSQLVKAEVGEIVKVKNIELDKQFLHKVLNRKSGPMLKAKYIYLDGTKMSIQQIDSVRSIIIEKYHQGITFEELHKTYNMDGGSNCELDWFCEGTMVEEFESAVANHKKGEIFYVDVPKNKWYYVSMKPEETKKVLITESFYIEYQ